MSRPIYEIAKEIRSDWSKQGRGISPYAKPYLDAMFTLDSIKENFIMDSGQSVVLYFLSNASSWRGDVAKRVKKELKDLCK